MTYSESWLHGWQRDGDTVWYGNASRCAGCGRFTGNVVTIGLSSDVPPIRRQEPDWPFKQEACPVCAAKEIKADLLTPSAVTLYKRVRELEAQLDALRRGM